MQNISIKNISITALLFSAMALSGWSIFLSGKSTLSNSISHANQPDIIIDDVTTTVINKMGLPTLKIISPKMTHYPENNTTHILAPRVTVYRQSPEPWYILSDYAKAIDGTTEVLFWSNVIIHHLPDEKDPLTTMKTSSLTIFPDSQTAKTDEAVTITQPNSTVFAVGMFANMNDGSVKLLSQARGQYAPAS